MRGRSPRNESRTPPPESYARLLANLAVTLGVVAALLFVVLNPAPIPPAVAPVVVVPSSSGPGKPRAVSVPRPSGARELPTPVLEPPSPELDRAAVARAEAALDAASRDRARAEARAEAEARALELTSKQVSADASAGRGLSARLRDPSARFAQASSRGGFLKAERDRLKDEVATLRKAPRPRPKQLADKNPVAQPAGGDEYHFELRRNRITFIDLDRLLGLVKADAQVRIRVNENSRGIESQVGPVGSFSLEYAMARSIPGGLEELMERRGISYNLRSWELVPEFAGRGETYETTRSPASEFARAINRLNPSRSTITMWVYPDGFALYRKLRDELHARGYLVAARPLPEGVAIRGSPAGSLSAGQ